MLSGQQRASKIHHRIREQFRERRISLVAQVVSDSETPWTAACQASLSFTICLRLSNSRPLSLMPSNRLILGHPLLLLPSIFPSIRKIFLVNKQTNKQKHQIYLKLPRWLNLSLWHPTPVFLPGKSHGRRRPQTARLWSMGSLRVGHD